VDTIDEPGLCTLPCPGNSLETCGGNAPSSLKRDVPAGELLDVYENTAPTSTTSSSSSTTETSSGTPNPSDEPESEPEKRNIHADIAMPNRRVYDNSKLRRGGMLRSPAKVEERSDMHKRDFGVKKPFGR